MRETNMDPIQALAAYAACSAWSDTRDNEAAATFAYGLSQWYAGQGLRTVSEAWYNLALAHENESN